MARQYTSGAEWQSNTDGVEITYGYSGTAGRAIDTTTIDGGLASYKFTGSVVDSNFNARYVLAADAAMWTKIRIYFTAFPTVLDSAILQHLDATDTTWRATIAIKSDGTLVLQRGNIGAAQIGSPSSALSLNTWYTIELKSEDGHGSAEIEARLNNSVFASETNAATFNAGVIYFGCCNNAGGEVFYIDNIAVNNNAAGGNETAYPTAGKVVLAKLTGAGDNAATSGVYSYANEVPPSDTCTASGTDMLELDTTTTIGDYNVTNSSTLGIDSYDTITLIEPIIRVREETSGASNYALRIKSAASGTVSESSLVDAGNTTVRTNPTGTVAFTNRLVSYTDPTTGVAWTPTGTNSVDNMQIGVKTTDGNPDIWVPNLAALIEYADGTAPGGSTNHFLSILGVGV